METREGIAQGTRYSSDVQGSFGKEGGSVSTTQIAIFQLGDQVVRLEGDGPPIVNDGDRLLVAGEEKNGVFKAYAYHNRTKHVAESRPFGTYLFFGGAFVAIGVITILIAALSERELELAILGVMFSAMGAFALREFNRISRAARLIKEAAESVQGYRPSG